MRSHLITLVAVLAGLASGAATPGDATNADVSDAGITFYSDDIVMAEEDMDQFFEEGNGLPEPEDVYGPFSEDDDRWDDELDGALADNTNGTALAARDKAHFRLFRREMEIRSCDRFGYCIVDKFDDVTLHTNCNGGGCDGEKWTEYNRERHLCDKTFKVCGTSYQMKYSGKSPSCARMKYIAKVNHGERYGKLMQGGTTKAICYFDRSKDYTRTCSNNRDSSYKSLVKCVWT